MVDSVRFPPNIGGSGRTYTSDANPETGMFNGGHRTNFFPMLEDTVQVAGYVSKYAQAIDGAKANADRAEDARGYVEAVADAYRVNILDAYSAMATVDLDFARGLYSVDDGTLIQTTELSELMTVVRSTSKRVEGPDGYLRETPQNEIAREWRGGVARGALIEGSATNLALWSEDITNAAWLKVGVSPPESPTVIDGVGFTALVAEASGLRYVYQVFTDTLQQGFVSACFKKMGDSETVYMRSTSGGVLSTRTFSLLTGQQLSGDVAVGALSYPLSSGGIVISIPVDDLSESIQIGFLSTGVDDSVFLGGVMASVHPGSYTPTTDSPSSRGADLLSMTLSKQYNPSGGTIIVDVEEFESNPLGFIFSLEGNALNRISLMHGSSSVGRPVSFTTRFDGVSDVINDTVPATPHVRKRVAVSWGLFTQRMAVDGRGQSISRSVESLPSVSVLTIGSRAGEANNYQSVNRMLYIPRQLTQLELERVTQQ